MPTSRQPTWANIETLKNKRILIFEDNISDLAILSTLLRHHQCEVIPINPRFHIASGKLDIDQIRRVCPIDLVLTDINLPNNLSGYDLIDQLQQITDLKHTPVVVLSAATAEEEIPHAR